MSELAGALAQLEQHLEGHVRYIVGAAGACSFGGNHAWDAVLSAYGEAHDAALKRLEEAQASGQSRGATMTEVRRAASAMCAQAATELDRITAPLPKLPGGGVGGDPALAQRIGLLRARLSQVPDLVVAEHARNVCPPKAEVAASVNSVFANAVATAKLTPWANVKFDAAKVLECKSCGAPQQVELDFLCRYCRTSMR